MIWTKKQIISYLQSKDDESLFKCDQYLETRTMAQNRLYHQWIEDLVWCFADKWIFITHDDLHEWLRDKLIKGNYEINAVTGKRVIKRKTTTQLNKKEFSQYLKDIEKYLWQTFEITYPLPTDLLYNN